MVPRFSERMKGEIKGQGKKEGRTQEGRMGRGRRGKKRKEAEYSGLKENDPRRKWHYLEV